MNPPKRERNERMKELYLAGRTLDELGELFGICDTRVWQILRREGVQTRKRGWNMKRAKAA